MPRRILPNDGMQPPLLRTASDRQGVMPHIGLETLLLVGAVALIASTLAAVTGFGGAALLLPVLVIAFGMRDAVPVLTVAQLIGNASRVWFNRRELDYRVVAWFALGGVPLALLGGLLFARAPLAGLTRLLASFSCSSWPGGDWVPERRYGYRYARSRSSGPQEASSRRSWGAWGRSWRRSS